MRIALFYHSLVSDWNHGNAHFLRGVARQLQRRGHQLSIYEPQGGWSVTNLIRQGGRDMLQQFSNAYPDLHSTFYTPRSIETDNILAQHDLVIVHEWNDPQLVAQVGESKARLQDRQISTATLLFHDTHHRCLSRPEDIAAFDLQHYDGVLAFGRVIAQDYQRRLPNLPVWTWHEAADTTVFHPKPDITPEADLVWIGNWGDDERTAELHEYLFEPIRQLKLRATIHGVGYPSDVQEMLADRGIRYGGYLPNFQVPDVFARHRVTVHVPRRPYVNALPGIPTIRPFEALACGIPLVSAPWKDSEGLFNVGQDFLMVDNGQSMTAALDRLLSDEKRCLQQAKQGLATLRARHTCAHRAEELLAIVHALQSANVVTHHSSAAI